MKETIIQWVSWYLVICLILGILGRIIKSRPDPLFMPASVFLWPLWLVFYVGFSLVGLIIVLVTYPKVPKFFAAPPDRPFTRWEMAVRNKAYGVRWLISKPDGYSSYGPGKYEMEPTEQNDKFRWRFSYHWPYSSLRMVWRFNEKKYGELYWGWTLDALDKDGFRFTPQIRPITDVGK